MGEVIDIPPTGPYSNYAGYGWCDAAGTTVPSDGDLGWAHGATFRHLDGSGATDAIYINIGDHTAANFDAIEVSLTPGKTQASRGFQIPLANFRVWDNLSAILPATAATDDLGLLTQATFPNATPAQIVSIDFGGTVDVSYARVMVPVPINYVAGEAVSLSLNACMEVVADTTAGIDVECVRMAAPNTELYAGAAVSVNTATATNTATYSLTSTNIIAGDILDLRLAFAGLDAGNAAPNIRLLLKSATMYFTTLQ